MATAKIIVTGLDNAGKTSLLLALEKKFSFEDEARMLKPTTRIDRNSFKFLNQQIFRWDYGGQEKYREEYLAHKDRFFSEIDIFFFVVDIQDRGRYVDAVKYFEEIVKFFGEKEMKVPIIVLLNKYDPQLHEDVVTEKAVISIKDMFSKIKEDLTVDYFETSIYSIDSVMRAFSQAFSRYLPRTELIANLFEEFAKANPCLAILLLDASGITIADYYRPQLTPEMRSAIREMRITGLKQVVGNKAENKEMKFFAELTQFPVENTELTIIVFTENSKSLGIELSLVIPRVTEILRGIFKE